MRFLRHALDLLIFLIVLCFLILNRQAIVLDYIWDQQRLPLGLSLMMAVFFGFFWGRWSRKR